MSARIFFTSDLHLGHENLVTFRNQVRGTSYSCAADHDQHLQNNWNSMVRSKDHVWVLGDVAWSKEDLEWLHIMNGHKKLILGNHDTERSNMSIEEYLPYFESIHGVHKKYDMVMTHVPIHPQELAYRWTTNIHGHIHHPERIIKDPRYINVNIDVRDGLPVRLDEIREEIQLGTTQKS